MTETVNRWHSFEHELYRNLLQQKVSHRKLVLMVSGGADSMAMLAGFLALRSALHLELSVLHCHHGSSKDPQQNDYRDRADLFVKHFCKLSSVDFHSMKAKELEDSESAFREFRKQAAHELMQKLGADFSVWAHHRDDFLETQILRLIRGTGPQALLEPMSFERGSELRPFLSFSRDEIHAYLRDKNIEWIEDPSNRNQDYLRNWLRQSWLPALEEKCPGALRSFSRSLDLLQESHSDAIPPEIWTEQGLDRTLFLTLNEAQKRQVLAQYLRRCGKLEFSQNQIKEVIKHLDISQLNHTFKAAAVHWSITRERIKITTPVVNPV